MQIFKFQFHKAFANGSKRLIMLQLQLDVVECKLRREYKKKRPWGCCVGNFVRAKQQARARYEDKGG